MDLFSRKIIARTLSHTPDASHVVDTINKVIAERKINKPLVMHSDGGCQYVSEGYRDATKKMWRSYSKKAYPWDNACIETFHALIKREWINRFKTKNHDPAYTLVFEYI